MDNEAQLVCIHSSFSKRFEIVSTRKLEQYWLSPQAFTRIIKSFHFFLLETAAIFIVLGLYINQFDRNVKIKSSAGSSPSSLVHFKHSQDWVIRGYTHIEFVARIRTGNPFRCAVTDHSYSALWKAFRATEPHISSPIFGGPSILLHHTTDECLQEGAR